MSFALLIALAGLSGPVVAGDEGCVTCHAGPMALNTLLPAKVENHADISAMVNTIPTDCAMCHAKGTPLALMEIVHARHEGVGCDNCHVVDENGAPGAVKTGAKNW
ncbi:MAG: hypothetical protein GWM87_06225 [Xanthomonadales bacterium]|nr:hypothetical protein [Xanthomonadales bacterium]NIX12567.1 hypothetical protein [Xanthomonadales bacterium]